MKVTYPVIFTDVNTNILVEVPDLEILTEANEEGKEKSSISDAIEMARDAIGLDALIYKMKINQFQNQQQSKILM